MKVVVLNSGGMDSVILLKWVKENLPDSDIHCIHFSYGQNNEEQEYSKALKSSSIAGAKFIHVRLPRIEWTSGGFYERNFDMGVTQELELRNLIFLSYAFSYCVSIGSNMVYAAFLKADEYYLDTSPFFVSWVNSMSTHFGVRLFAPLQDEGKYKDELGDYIRKYDIREDDFFSCNTPVDGKPCGVCPDCLCIKELFQTY